MKTPIRKPPPLERDRQRCRDGKARYYGKRAQDDAHREASPSLHGRHDALEDGVRAKSDDDAQGTQRHADLPRRHRLRRRSRCSVNIHHGG